MQAKQINEVIINGVKVSAERLQELMQDPSVKVIPLKEGEYKTLTKMEG